MRRTVASACTMRDPIPERPDGASNSLSYSAAVLRSCSARSSAAVVKTHASASRLLRPWPQIIVDRVWATTLAMCVAETFDSTWLTDAEEERTIVDHARGWLEGQAR